MTSLSDLLQQGTAHAWLFFPSAILLGALHGLEPGHSKTMMAAFIIAVRGTVAQAVLLGLSAAISHSLLIWVIAAAGLYFGSQLDLEQSEPWFQLASAVMIAVLALWMFWRTRRDLLAEKHHGESHDHHGHDHPHDHPHDHGHAHAVVKKQAGEYQDAHEVEHAQDIERRFAGRQVTTGQIILFGITGGLLPCPAAISILLICLQLKQMLLGFSLVLAFSAGLALTMVMTGAVAAWSIRHMEKRFSGFGRLARQAPYISVVVLMLVAMVIGTQAAHALLK